MSLISGELVMSNWIGRNRQRLRIYKKLVGKAGIVTGVAVGVTPGSIYEAGAVMAGALVLVSWSEW